MRFVWHAGNVGHIARHGLGPREVEAVFEAEDLGITARRGRWVAEGTVTGRVLRVVFTLSGPDEAHVITAYPIERRRRRT